MHLPYAALLIDFLFGLYTEEVKPILPSFLDELGLISHPLSSLGYYIVYLEWHAIGALTMILFALLIPFYLCF